MARSLSSPSARIGVLVTSDVIRCTVQGRHRLKDAQGHTLATIDEMAGQLEFKPAADAQPAVVEWRSVLCKSPTREDAERYIVGLPPLPEGQDWSLETVGHEWQCPDGKLLDGREWWVHSPGFATRAECHAWCHERDLPHIDVNVQPRMRRPPRGLIACQSAGITASGLDGAALFRLEPEDPRGSRIALSGVVVGIHFHWQHLERQWLRGNLEILLDREGKLTAVNELPLEAYLCSVVGSEMKAEMPHELLKVQAVCARNTFLATAGKHHRGDPYDLCNDDHCQCYRGSSRETQESREAAVSTWGEVLVAEDRLVDARYSKICGGISESAASVWGGPEISYMTPVPDFPSDASDRAEPPMSDEKAARAFIDKSPHAFCNVRDRDDIPEYLEYAGKYFRWEVTHSREQLEKLLARLPETRAVGEPVRLEARRRGASGRIEQLAVIGTEDETVIGRELTIRQVLSESTLYSSCFVADHEHDADGRLVKVTLRGGGWGHGAGMCQVGATVMALEDYTHEQILTHYFKGAHLRLLYDQPTNWSAVLDHFDDGDFSVHDRCWEATNCYEVVGCPVYEKKVGPDKGYIENANRSKMYLDCPEYERQREDL